MGEGSQAWDPGLCVCNSGKITILGLAKYADPEDGHQARLTLRQMWARKVSKPGVWWKYGLQWEESFQGRNAPSDKSHHPKGNAELYFSPYNCSSLVAAPRPMNPSTQWSFLPRPMFVVTQLACSLSGSQGNRDGKLDQSQVCPNRRKDVVPFAHKCSFLPQNNSLTYKEFSLLQGHGRANSRRDIA